MKEFFKWLGVNEKVAKVAIWMLIIMVTLTIFNIAFDSFGLPYYKITVDNLMRINTHKIFEYLLSWIICLLNFYTVIFLVFRIKNFKKVLPYSILYLILNITIQKLFNYGILQIFIVICILIFCYFYSGKKWKYILYGITAYIINVIVQYIWFMYKGRFIDLTTISKTTEMILTIDFFIIMFIIIISKEIYLKKRSEKEWLDAYCGLENSKKKETSQKK